MMTREEWLNEMTKKLARKFIKHDFPLPEKLRVSCGWPARRALGKKRAVGQCWAPEASKDVTTEIFVSPCIEDAVEVAAILVHELVHAAVGHEEGHKGNFKKLALALGLCGKMTSTEAGDELKSELAAFCKQIGAYPHAQLDALLNPEKKQSTRLIKLACPACGYTCRTTQKWLDVGTPTCCCGEDMATA